MSNDLVFEREDHRLQTARESVRLCQYDLENLQHLCTSYETQLKEAREAYMSHKKARLAALRLANHPDRELFEKAFDKSLDFVTTSRTNSLDCFRDRCQYNRRYLRLKRERLPAAESAYASAKQELIRVQLQPGLGPITYNRAWLRRKLKEIENVTTVSIRESTNYYTIAVTFSDMTMSCVEDQVDVMQFAVSQIAQNIGDPHQRSIVEQHDPTAIPVPDCRISLKLNKTRNYGATFNGSRIGSQHRRFHPHWLSNRNPCFGDYDNAIWTCARDRDIITTFVLVRMFLGTYNMLDPEGRAGIYYGLPNEVRHLCTYSRVSSIDAFIRWRERYKQYQEEQQQALLDYQTSTDPTFLTEYMLGA